MYTDTHTGYLRVMLRTSEDRTKGWEGLLDYATPRVPEPILAELRAQLAESKRETEGWRGLHDYASANRALPAELAQAEAARLAADVAQYSTGARLDVMPPPCTCGAPNYPGVTHRQGGHPCDPVYDTAPTGRQDEPGQDPTQTGVLPEGWTPDQEGHFEAFQGIHAGREQVAPGEYGVERPPSRLAAFLKPKDGQS